MTLGLHDGASLDSRRGDVMAIAPRGDSVGASPLTIADLRGPIRRSASVKKQVDCSSHLLAELLFWLSGLAREDQCTGRTIHHRKQELLRQKARICRWYLAFAHSIGEYPGDQPPSVGRALLVGEGKLPKLIRL